MATDLKTLKKQVYSTPMDVRLMSAEFFRDTNYSGTIDFDDPRVEHALLQAKGIIDLYLGSIITSESSLEITPFAGPPLRPKADMRNEGENQTQVYLYGIQPASTAYTELWTIDFSSATAYSVKGSFSGAQGSGTISTAFTSTNTDIVIPNDVWYGTPASGDRLLVCVYKHHQSIVVISSMLAAAFLYKSIAGENPDSGNQGNDLYKKAIDALEMIQNGDSGLLGVDLQIDTSDIMVPYEVSVRGDDVSNYSNDEYDRYTSTQYNCWWANGCF